MSLVDKLIEYLDKGEYLRDTFEIFEKPLI